MDALKATQPIQYTSLRAGRSEVLLPAAGLIRVASLPSATVVALRPVRSNALIDEALVCYKSERLAGALLDEALYDAVACADDDGLRRVLIKIRRSLRAGRHHRTRSDLAALSATLKEVRECCALWEGAADSYEALLARIDALLDVEVLETNERLMAIASDSRILPNIVTAAPVLAEQLMKDGALRASLSGKERRILLSYVVRAALKTSPFGGFTFVGALPIRPDDDDLLSFAGMQTSKACHPSRGLLTRIRVSEGVDWKGCERLRINPFLRRKNDKIRSLSSTYTMHGILPWRPERVAGLSMNDEVFRILDAARPEADACDLLRALVKAGLSAERADSLLSRFVATGILIRSLDYDGLTTDFSSEECSQTTRDLARRAESYAAAAPGARLAIIGALNKDYLAPSDSADFKPQSYFMETGYVVLPQAILGKAMRRYVADLSPVVHNIVVASPLHDRMATLFQSKFGVGGVCTDLAAFLFDVDEHCREHPIRLDNLERPRGDYRLLTTIFGQYALGGEAGSKFVVNRINPFGGGVTARFLQELGKHDPAVRDAYKQWLRVLAGGQEPIDFLIFGEVLDLQAHAQLTERVLAWPLEPIGKKRARVELQDLSLSYGAETGRFILRDRHGISVLPVYLGAVVAQPGWGPLFYLLNLFVPLTIRNVAAPAVNANEELGDVVPHQRIELGSLILARRRWSVRSAYMKEKWFSFHSAKRLLSVARDLAVREMPTHFFARVVDFDADPKWLYMGNLRKPLWFDTRNPISLDILERLTDSGQWLEITETLPDIPDASNGKPSYVSEIQFEAIFCGSARQPYHHACRGAIGL